MTKTELHEILKKDDNLHFSFKGEKEFHYLFSILEKGYRYAPIGTVSVEKIVIDVRNNTQRDWGEIHYDYYINKKIHHLDFSEEKEIKEENIELNVQINEYTGKLSIPFEALQELKKGAKLKLL